MKIFFVRKSIHLPATMTFFATKRKRKVIHSEFNLVMIVGRSYANRKLISETVYD